MRFVRLTAGLLMVAGLSACWDDTPPPAKKAAKPPASAPAADKPAETASATTEKAPAPAEAAKPAGGDRIVMELKDGPVVIALRPDLAPQHVERMKKLAKEGFYNGLKFHRVIDGFMAQTGDPTGTGAGGSEYSNLRAEFTQTPFERGTLGAARTNDPDSANSQFFICFTDTGCRMLNGKYTVFGKVASGMELVDKIKKGAREENGTVTDPDTIVKMYVE
jgi:peptidylprolyl isomerase